jgi:hypothetical protein
LENIPPELAAEIDKKDQVLLSAVANDKKVTSLTYKLPR